MADAKITALTALTAPTTDDLVAIVDDPAGVPVTKKITLANLIGGASALFVSNVTVQILTATAGSPYVPTSGMKKVLFIAVGPGGNGASITAVDEMSGGGGGGGTCIRLMTAAQIGSSKAYTIGATSGNNTTLNTTDLVANSGNNGSASGLTTTLGVQAAGGAGGTASGGDLNISGEPGQRGIMYSGADGCGGAGGSSMFGAGGAESGTEAAGANGTTYGGGGGGAHCAGGVDRAGGTGAAGVIYAIEFIS